VISLLGSAIALAGPVGTASGFEDDDGNLVDDAALTGIDWNTFDDPLVWSPHPATTPNRQASETSDGWKVLGLEDWAATTADSGFAGGTKQDDNCPNVIGAKAPNKDDLKRVYVSSKTVDDHVYLNLAWVRIPQNTTSPSAHIGFEFNKGGASCGEAGGLVQRSAGDMLIVYDFEGSSTDNPTLTLRRWVTSGACEISSNSAPCWGPATNLTAGGFAEGKVNTFGSVLDALSPPALSSTTGNSVDVTLGTNEFGEAGIDLTAAGVFGPDTCSGFGKVYAVSRSSGNSGTAQMKDLVGPGDFDLNNCGTVTIIKHTDPAGVDQDFDFTSDLAGDDIDCSEDADPAAFTLNDADVDTETCTNVPIGDYTVTEGTDPAGFVFGSLTCEATGDGTGEQDADVDKQANISINSGGDTVTCTYVNNQQLGAIKVTKTDSKTDNALAGAEFSVTGPNEFSTTLTTDANGEACVDGLAFGDYTVTETGAPTGYVIDDETGHTVTVDTNAGCDDAEYGGESIAFTDTPTSDIQVRFRDGGSGVTSLVSITCDNTTGTSDTDDTQDWDDTLTITGIEAPTTINCEIVIDP
jgi:prealbumin domain-containing protein